MLLFYQDISPIFQPLLVNNVGYCDPAWSNIGILKAWIQNTQTLAYRLIFHKPQILLVTDLLVYNLLY